MWLQLSQENISKRSQRKTPISRGCGSHFLQYIVQFRYTYQMLWGQLIYPCHTWMDDRYVRYSISYVKFRAMHFWPWSMPFLSVLWMVLWDGDVYAHCIVLSIVWSIIFISAVWHFLHCGRGKGEEIGVLGSTLGNLGSIPGQGLNIQS